MELIVDQARQPVLNVKVVTPVLIPDSLRKFSAPQQLDSFHMKVTLTALNVLLERSALS